MHEGLIEMPISINRQNQKWAKIREKMWLGATFATAGVVKISQNEFRTKQKTVFLAKIFSHFFLLPSNLLFRIKSKKKIHFHE